MTALAGVVKRRTFLPRFGALPARPAPPRTGVRLRPTGHGVVYVVLLAALLVGSINHNNNLGYLLTFLLGSILLISIVFTLRNARGFTCQGGGEAIVFAGQDLPFALLLQALDGPCYGLALSLDGKSWVTAAMAGRLPVSCQVFLPTSRRGRVAIDRVFMTSVFPLGLFRARREIPVVLTGLVCPKPRQTTAGGEQSAEERREDGKSPAHDEQDFAGLRPYHPGDSPKRMHWPSLAARRGLFVKVFEADEGGSAVFSLADMPGKNLEVKLGELCFLVLQANNHNSRYGLRLGGQLISPGHGPVHKNACLRALALYQSP